MKQPFPSKIMLASFLLGVVVTILVFIPVMKFNTRQALENNLTVSSSLGEFMRDNQLPYEISKEKSARLIENYRSLEFGMSLEAVEALLGKPDRKTIMPIFHSNKQFTSWVWYFSVKDPREIDRNHDRFVQVNFNSENEYYETISNNVAEVEDRRDPKGL